MRSRIEVASTRRPSLGRRYGSGGAPFLGAILPSELLGRWAELPFAPGQELTPGIKGAAAAAPTVKGRSSPLVGEVGEPLGRSGRGRSGAARLRLPRA